jgi:hypothetical protein
MCPEMGIGVSTRLGSVVFLVFLPKERLAHLFPAEADLPKDDARLLPTDEAIHPKDADPHAGLMSP